VNLLWRLIFEPSASKPIANLVSLFRSKYSSDPLLPCRVCLQRGANHFWDSSFNVTRGRRGCGPALHRRDHVFGRVDGNAFFGPPPLGLV